MIYADQWKALSSRILGLMRAGQLHAQFLLFDRAIPTLGQSVSVNIASLFSWPYASSEIKSLRATLPTSNDTLMGWKKSLADDPTSRFEQARLQAGRYAQGALAGTELTAAYYLSIIGLGGFCLYPLDGLKEERNPHDREIVRLHRDEDEIRPR